MSQYNILMLALFYFIYSVLGRIFYIVDLPRPVEISSYSSKSLTFTWVKFSTETSYKVIYTHNSTETQVSTTDKSLSISCEPDQLVTIYYLALFSDETFSTSPKRSIACTTPVNFQVILTQTLQNLTIHWDSSIKSPFSCYLFEISNSNPIQILNVPFSSSQIQISSQSASYMLGCHDFNTFYNQTFSVPLINIPKSDKFKINVPSVGYTLTAFDVLVTVPEPGVFVYAVFEARDVCSLTIGFDCERVTSSSSNYNSDLLTSYVYYNISGTDNLTLEYYPPLVGKYSMSIIMLQPGVLAYYWDNIWYDDTYETKTHKNINFTWTGLLTTYSNEFVSAEFFAFLVPKYTENYTFFLDVDDNAKVYIDGNIFINAWDVCCQVFQGVVFLNADQYYYLKIEYRQLYSDSRLVLYWSSRSQSKEIIPEECLWMPTRVGNSPWVQTVSLGNSRAELCYFTGSDEIKAGYQSTLTFYSVNYNGVVTHNSKDVFTVKFNENYQQISTYSGNGVSSLTYSLTKAGVYSVTIQLYGKDILGSPWTLTVESGDIGALTTYSDIDSAGPYYAGSFMNFTVSLFDAYNNTLTSFSTLSFSMYLTEPNLSDLDISAPSNWLSTYNKTVVQYSFPYVYFKSYVSGTYQVLLKTNDLLIKDYPMTINIEQSEFMPEHSVVTYESTSVIAGETFSANIQARDNFYNNLTSNFSIKSYKFISSSENTGTIKIDNGQFLAEIILTKAGINTLNLSINSVSIQMPTISVEANALLSYSYSTLTSDSNTGRSGDTITSTIAFKDLYGNTQYNPGDDHAVRVEYSDFNIIDNQDGTYSITFVPLSVGSYKINVYINSFHISGSPLTITISASTIRGIYSDFKNLVVTAGQGVLNITSKDMGENIIKNPVRNSLMGLQYYTSTLIGPTSLSKNASFVDYSCFNINITQITKAGTYKAVLSLFESGGLIGFYYKDSEFTNLLGSLDYNNFVSTSPEYYSIKDPNINFDWTDSNPKIDSEALPSLFSGQWQGNLYIAYTETYTFTLNTDCKVTLTVAGQVVFDTISSGSIKNSLSGSLKLTASTIYQFLLKYQNCGIRGYLRLYYSSASESFKIIPSSAFYAQINSENSPYTVTIEPYFTSADNCVISSDSTGIYTAKAGVIKTFTITAYDKYGNKQTKDDTFLMIFPGNTELYCSGSAGVYSCEFTFTKTGRFLVSGFIKHSNGAVEILNKYYITVTPGSAFIDNTQIQGLENVVAGVWESFFINLYDKYSNPLNSGGDQVQVEICKFNETSENSTNCDGIPDSQLIITDMKTGTYNVTFLIYSSFNYAVHITINSETYNSTDTIFVYPTDPYPELSELIVPENVTLPGTLKYSVILRDKYSNLINSTQAVFSTFYMQSNTNFIQQKLILTSISESEYSVSFDLSTSSIDKSGTCSTDSSPSTCNFQGDIEIKAWVVDQGLIGSYFSNLYFSGVPVKTTVEKTMDFKFESTVYGTSVNKLSVFWEGIVYGSVDGLNLTISGSESALGIVDGLELMNLVDKTQCALKAEDYYFVQFRYNNTAASGQFRLSLTEDPSVSIPSNYLGHFKDNTEISGQGKLTTIL